MPEQKLLLFEKWDLAGIKVEDQGLQKSNLAKADDSSNFSWSP